MTKKLFTFALAAFLMFLTLSSCGKKNFVGEWNVSIDFGKAIKDSISDDPFGIDADFSGIDIKTTIYFDENGTYTIQFGEDSLNDAARKLVDIIVDDVYDNLDLDALGDDFDMTKEEYYDLMKDFTTAEVISQRLGIEGSGNYTYSGGKITLENGITMTYKIDGDDIEVEFQKDSYSFGGTGTRTW